MKLLSRCESHSCTTSEDEQGYLCQCSEQGKLCKVTLETGEEMFFYYCPEAIEIDKSNGFKVEAVEQ